MTGVTADSAIPIASGCCRYEYDHVYNYELEARMSLATQRLIVPITAKDKARVERKAAKAGKISTAEFVRRAALNYEPADEGRRSCARLPIVSRSFMPPRSLSLIAPMRPSTRRSPISRQSRVERN